MKRATDFEMSVAPRYFLFSHNSKSVSAEHLCNRL